jgi:hypothetical protein
MASERAKNLGKKIIEYPEGQPSVLSSKDWIQNLAIVKDPKHFVTQFGFQGASFYSLNLDSPLSCTALPNIWLDHSLQ